MSLANELGKHLFAAKLAKDAAQARKLLSELSGKLIVHLAAEDMLLYPQLLECKDPAARTLASRFIAEMGSIAQVFKNYVVRWNATTDIQSNPQAFVAETRAIIKALDERIHKENTQLYPLADKL